MNIENLCLGILSERPASGYDIARLVRSGELALIAQSGQASIYAALKRLEQRALVSSSKHFSEGKPARTVYEITAEGREALLAEAAGALPDEKCHSPFLLLLYFAEAFPEAVVRKHIHARRQRLAEYAKCLGAHKSRMKPGTARQWIVNAQAATLDLEIEQLDGLMSAIGATGSKG